MLKQVIFYKIIQSCIAENNELQLNDQEIISCRLTMQLWQNNNRILIACATQQQAELLDEALWGLEPTRFIPHNLANEIYSSATPIELCWPTARSVYQRNILINLMPNVPEFSLQFQQVIDFVPLIETEKQLARERYKTYRNYGFNLEAKDYLSTN